jgi:hypothetical protein
MYARVLMMVGLFSVACGADPARRSGPDKEPEQVTPVTVPPQNQGKRDAAAAPVGKDAGVPDGSTVVPPDGSSPPPTTARDASGPDGEGPQTPPAPDGGPALPRPTRPAGDRLTFYVSPTGDDANAGTSRDKALKTVNIAVDWAMPGDTVVLLPGVHLLASDPGGGGDIATDRDGKPDAPITIKGSGDGEAIVKSREGSNRDRMFYVAHSHWSFEGFTIEGLRIDAPKICTDVVDTAIFLHGGVTLQTQPDGTRKWLADKNRARQGVTGVKIRKMTIRNCGGECIRMRYFCTKNEVSDSHISRAGRLDYQLGGECRSGAGKNGEGIYIGSADDQWADATKNATNEPDQSTENLIRGNTIDTQANECVEMKEGATKNVVEDNVCTNQNDENSGGIASRGSGNIIRRNKISKTKGAGIRLGGDQGYGTNNDAYENEMSDNGQGAFNITRKPQGKVCGNKAASPGSTQGIAVSAACS